MKKSIYLLIMLMFSGFSGLFAQEQGSGKFSGVIFGEYYINQQRDPWLHKQKNINTPDTVMNKHGFSLKRIDLVYDYKFNDKFSTCIRFDADGSSLTSKDKITTWMKDAYLQYNYHPKHSVVLGIQIPPGYPLAEALWGNRFIGLPIEDWRGYISSRDMGIAFKGSFGENGRIKYHAMYGNNNYGTVEADKYKRGYACLEFMPVDNFYISLYGDYAGMSDAKFLNHSYNRSSATGKLMLGYKKENVFNGAIVAFVNKKKNFYETTTGYENQTGNGLSIFGTYWINTKWSAVARFDFFDPHSENDYDGDKRQLYIFSINYKPMAKLTVAPNILIESYEKIGSYKLKSSITPQFSFVWTF